MVQCSFGSIPTQPNPVQVLLKFSQRDPASASLVLQHEEVLTIPAQTAPFAATYRLQGGVAFAGTKSPVAALSVVPSGLAGVNEDTFTVIGHGYLVAF